MVAELFALDVARYKWVLCYQSRCNKAFHIPSRWTKAPSRLLTCPARTPRSKLGIFLSTIDGLPTGAQCARNVDLTGPFISKLERGLRGIIDAPPSTLIPPVDLWFSRLGRALFSNAPTSRSISGCTACGSTAGCHPNIKYRLQPRYPRRSISIEKPHLLFSIICTSCAMARSLMTLPTSFCLG